MRNAGLTFVEVMIATVIVGVGLVAATDAVSNAAIAKAELTDAPATAARLAAEIYEVALTLPTEPAGLPAATQGAEVSALANLDGAKFSPPIDAQLKAVADAKGWEQKVDLQAFALSDLSKPTSEAYVASGDWSSSIVKLTVVVSYRGVEMGTWAWWLNP